MKNSTLIKIVVVTCACILATFALCPCATAEHSEIVGADRGEFYPLLTVVVEVNGELVTCEDMQGNLWAFYSDEGDWTVNDMANLLMWNMGGAIEEDEIIEAYWEGIWR